MQLLFVVWDKSKSSPARFYRGADKSLARPTSLCILFGGENISFDASLVLYTGLLKMIVGLLTTCYTQYTWDRSI